MEGPDTHDILFWDNYARELVKNELGKWKILDIIPNGTGQVKLDRATLYTYRGAFIGYKHCKDHVKIPPRILCHSEDMRMQLYCGECGGYMGVLE